LAEPRGPAWYCCLVSAKGASKAEALQRSELALMQRTDKPYFAHPALWAPFVVVGEGNSAWK